MEIVPVAHAGHWLPYVVPAVVVLIAVVVSTVRERRRRDEDG
jgi:cytochrome c-type biogenesis protein CcmH/NrfF